MAALEKQSLGQKKGSVWFSIKKLLVRASNTRLNDGTMRSQNMQVTNAFLDDQVGSVLVDHQQPISWDLLDDYQFSMMGSDPTLFAPHNPLEFANNWSSEESGFESAMPFNP